MPKYGKQLTQDVQPTQTKTQEVLTASPKKLDIMTKEQDVL